MAAPAGFGLAAVSCGGVSRLVAHGLVIAFIALPQDALSRGAIGYIAKKKEKKGKPRPSRVNPGRLAKVKTERKKSQVSLRSIK